VRHRPRPLPAHRRQRLQPQPPRRRLPSHRRHAPASRPVAQLRQPLRRPSPAPRTRRRRPIGRKMHPPPFRPHSSAPPR
jgi:hypothetical protein